MTAASLPAVKLPPILFRVDYLEGFGFPECERQEQTKRTYERAQDAADMIAEIQRLPEHHVLIRVSRGDVVWSDLDPAQLPPARERSKA